MAATAQIDQVQLVISSAVDPAFYRQVYRDVDPATHPAAHYARAGWLEGRDPAPWFSTSAYLAANEDVARAGVNPFHHYLTSGRREGRDAVRSDLARQYYAGSPDGDADAFAPHYVIASPARPPPAPAPPPPPEVIGDTARAAVAAEFDTAFYLATNPDVAASGVDPLEHFLIAGWREGRDPSAHFSLADYLKAYPDIGAAGVNPFVHFVTAGRAEGRVARIDLGFRHRIIEELVPVETRVAAATKASAAIAADDPAGLRAVFAASRTGWRDLHLTFSHDDFSANLGGVQICLQREAARIAEAGLDHLHLFPAVPWPTVRAAGEPGPLGVWWNGKMVGRFDAPAIAEAVRVAAAVTPGRRGFAIHSLLGHSIDETLAIMRAADLSAGVFWLHDFASLCAGFHLLRNDVADCGAPPPDSAACGICAYQPLRARHLEAHARLFGELRLTVAAPAQSTLDTWRAGGGHPAAAGEIILPHARLVERPDGARGGPASDGTFRFAYVGLPSAHKGWPIFRALALKYAGDRRYAFLHLGVRTDAGLPIAHHPVMVGPAQPQAMCDAIEALGVDAAMVWPLCRETFSLTAYEAAAAGAAVVTGPDSGNVAAFVQEGGWGRVLTDEAALDAAFASGEILELAREVRNPKRYDLVFSGLTADLPPELAT
jgi:hypothetical protein